MSRSDFHFEFNKEVSRLSNEQIGEVEQRLRTLAEDHTDMVGAAVAVEELTHDKTPHLFQARVVVYIRPENIAAEEKADSADMALTGALEAVERQVRQRRTKLRERWAQPELVSDQGVYELTATEIYQTFVAKADPATLLAMERADLASQLMIDHNLEKAAAFYAADQILVRAQELVDGEWAGAEPEPGGDQPAGKGIIAINKEKLAGE
ncbi:MAG: HPF/RaiA family ribosome-associated protein [Anaerolineae bacterium]|nr:HPF/RaiA family ribosome-associated protein [Anaerolineae bacterium]